MDRYLLDSLQEFEDGWGFRFTDENFAPARAALTGDWSEDWAAIACPILLLHGRKSWAVSTSERSEEHTSELQSLMRISYAVCCLKKKRKKKTAQSKEG